MSLPTILSSRFFGCSPSSEGSISSIEGGASTGAGARTSSFFRSRVDFCRRRASFSARQKNSRCLRRALSASTYAGSGSPAKEAGGDGLRDSICCAVKEVRRPRGVRGVRGVVGLVIVEDICCTKECRSGLFRFCSWTTFVSAIGIGRDDGLILAGESSLRMGEPFAGICEADRTGESKGPHAVSALVVLRLRGVDVRLPEGESQRPLVYCGSSVMSSFSSFEMSI
mmetsp:Transcript_15736/g.61456  ORF Transcript_15736/g.61456 Transcript_15736/m.61456 type:complete len:226 (-) Transcript_15736:392-1069(-)